MIAWLVSSALASPLHFVVVGNAQYAEAPGVKSWNPLPAASATARRMTQRLVAMGGVGTRLDSKPGALVSRADLVRVIERQGAAARRDKDDPLLVVYLMGHGLGEGLAWFHWTIPGELTIPSNVDAARIDEVALSATGLAERLDALKVPYLVLLDSCYEGEPQSFDSPVLSATASQNLRDVASVLRFMNELHQSNPVVFSAEPGTYVGTVPDPTPQARNEVGPLARRFLLATGPVLRGATLSLGELVGRLTDPAFDPGYGVGVSFAEDPPDRRFAAYPSGSAQVQTGSATEPRVVSAPVSVAAPPPTAPSGPLPRFALTLEGADGDWVTDGRDISSVALVERPWPIATDKRELNFTFATADGREGSLELVAPAGRDLAVGIYKKAERAHMGSDKRLGLSVSFDGRGCNTSRGAAEIEAITFAGPGELSSLQATFTHSCDGGPALRGTVRAEAR